MILSKGQIMMIQNMVNTELSNKNTVYDPTELVNLKEQLKLYDVVSSKRFTDTDMLNAYIRGFKDADVDESGLGFVKTDVIIENGLKWLKEYHK